MLAGEVYMEHHNQVVGIIHICGEYGLEVPGSRWETPPTVVAGQDPVGLPDLD